MVFFSGPILSDKNQLNVTLPEESGYAWTWLAKDKDGDKWSKTETDKIGKFSSQATFSSPQKIYEGWLELVKLSPKKQKKE